MRQRASQPATYLFFFGSFALVVFLIHAPYFRLPYFWDELGQFVPSALDIFHDGAGCLTQRFQTRTHRA